MILLAESVPIKASIIKIVKCLNSEVKLTAVDLFILAMAIVKKVFL